MKDAIEISVSFVAGVALSALYFKAVVADLKAALAAAEAKVKSFEAGVVAKVDAVKKALA